MKWIEVDYIILFKSTTVAELSNALLTTSEALGTVQKSILIIERQKDNIYVSKASYVGNKTAISKHLVYSNYQTNRYYSQQVQTVRTPKDHWEAGTH